MNEEFQRWIGGKIHQIYRIVGDNNNSGFKYSCKKTDTSINGKQTYHRIFIKRIGYEYYDEDGIFNAVLDNADEEDQKWYMNLIENKFKN